MASSRGSTPPPGGPDSSLEPESVASGIGDPQVTRGVLSGQVKDVLLRWIVDGRLPMGSRIVETQVARTLHTSQAPVREALRDLETLGVVEIEPFRGARVRRPSHKELLEAFSVRAEIEALASREATPLLTASVVEELERCLHAMRKAAAVNDTHAHAVANARFHGAIVAAAGNRTLARVWSVLEPFARTYITSKMAAAAAVDLHHLAERHQVILDAMLGGDIEKAASSTRVHMHEAKEILRRALETSSAGGQDGTAVNMTAER